MDQKYTLSYILNLFSSFTARDNISYKYKTVNKII